MKVKVSKDQESELRILMRDTGRTTPEEVLNDAMTAYDWLVRNSLFGLVIAAVDADDDVITHFDMESLQTARSLGLPCVRDEDMDFEKE